ncbi:hypothetical protein ACFL18_00220 [Patescibacteria group bacterium]
MSQKKLIHKIHLWKSKHTFLLIFSLFFLYSFRNAIFFPPRGSFDIGSHYRYAKILITEWRFPIPEESVHFHNPPLWYFIGSLSITISENLLKLNNWKQTIKIWQLINPILTSLTLFYWLKMYQAIYPKKIKRWLFFSFFLFSLPILSKMTAMVSIEPLLLTLSSMALFVYLKFLINPNKRFLLVLGIILGLGLLSKITLFSLVLTFFIMLIYLKIVQSLSARTLIKNLAIFFLPIILFSGWFYTWKHYHYGILRPGGVEYSPKKQEASFYFDIPIRLMFTYPIRHYEVGRHLGRTFLPIMYTDFWGDYWNYYSQQRYGIDIEYIRTIDRYKTTPERVKALVAQSVINIPATILMTAAFFWACWITFKTIIRRNYSVKNLFYLSLIVFFALSSLGYLWFQSRSPKWTGSNVKPYHLLFVWPVPVFFATEALFTITKNKTLLRSIILLFFIFTFIYNLVFTWF